MNTTVLQAHAALTLEKIRLPNPEWDEFIAAHPHHLFHKSVWAQALEQGYRAVSYYGLKQDGRMVLGLPGMILNFNGFKVYYACTPYGGFVGDPSFIPAFLELFSRDLKKQGVDVIRITQNADQENWPALDDFRVLKGHQHAIDFRGRSTEQIIGKFNKNAERNVRRAGREGLTLRFIRGAEDIQLYYEMYVLAMKRLGALRPHTRQLYEAVYERLIKQNQGTILFAERKNKTVAAMFLLYDRGTVYFFGSAFDPDAQALRPNDFLMDHAIRFAREQGFSSFDFMTTAASQLGLVQYKEKWGAAGRPFLIHEKSLNPFKAAIWGLLWWLANTPIGSFLIDAFRKD